ncbi:hypothetical protein [Streptomyces sp. NBC_01006]|uniref:hypothetical protein n=1 Tax=Streptomyces sp. NBC_01006 TaxID=2903716 RepID=UPI003870EA6C|nr:hypothetical protein OG509_39595 [Streptomyces sp. NBC_01006]
MYRLVSEGVLPHTPPMYRRLSAQLAQARREGRFRDLKFRGYEVFRFGHDELRDRDPAQPLLAGFFATLLDRPPAGPPRVPLPAQP